MTGRAYRLLLRAYPRALRDAHGEEMVTLVQDRAGDGEPIGSSPSSTRATVFLTFVAGLFLTATAFAMLAGSQRPPTRSDAGGLGEPTGRS